MAGRSTITYAERQTSVQTQQSAYGACVPVVYGTARVGGNLIWYANFQATAHTVSSGKAGSSTTYTYSASAIMALAEGPITGIGTVWKDNAMTTLAELNLTMFTGSPTQAVWSFLTGYSNSSNYDFDGHRGYRNYLTIPAFASQAIPYSGTAFIASSAYALTGGATVPNHNFEVQGLAILGATLPDAHPAVIIKDMLTNQQYGMGFNTAWVADLSNSAASYDTYCTATGLFVSPAYLLQRPGTDVIKELTDATNSAPVWSGGILNIIPYGDTAITANSVTYTPSLTPLYDLGDDDFIDNGSDSPILITRSTPADAYNRFPVQFKNRANQYNQEVAYAEDQDAIETYGLKVASTITADFICVPSIAKQMAQLALQRSLYKRNMYEFEVNARYAMLEPMDIVTLTDSGLGMTKLPVRIIEISEQDDSFRIVAEDMNVGAGHAATYAHDSGVRWTTVLNIAPIDCAPPVIFELPADPIATGLSLAIAAGGQTSDYAYGGCNIWWSLDGTNYKHDGTIYGSSPYGTLTADMVAHASGTDTTTTAALALRSNGQLLSGSAADVAKGTTLVICNGEYFAYQTATLTGTNAYSLTTLNRGLYGTTGGLHVNGSAWVRVDRRDGSIAILPDLDLTMIGQTVYIKLTAFNIYGQAEQALSAVTAYTYTITGNMKALQTPVDFANVGGTTKPANNATVGAPAGTSVAGRAAADVASTIATGGGVAANQVATAAIVANSVSSIASASASSITWSDAFNAGTSNHNLISATYTPTAASSTVLVTVSVSGFAFLTNSSLASTTTSVVITESVSGKKFYIAPMTVSSPQTTTFQILFTGLTGTQTFSVTGAASGGGSSTQAGNGNVSFAVISVLELKK